MPLDYAIYDVFCDEPLAGNPLAVVFEADGLSTERMQAIAGEFNLSETVFLAAPENSGHAAAARIFTPKRELPFAGHPTVGAAVAIASLRPGGKAVDRLIVIEEKIGPVRCMARADADGGFAEFDLPRLPKSFDLELDPAAIALAMGLEAAEIGFENHRPSLWSAGVPFVCVPVHGLAAASRIRVEAAQWDAIAPVVDGIPCDIYAYCRDTVLHDSAFHARMFAPGFGIAEDPATGSAAAAFSGVVEHFDGLADGPTALWIEQGFEMGRPSRIRLEIDAEAGRMVRARIGGEAVKVAEGRLLL